MKLTQNLQKINDSINTAKPVLIYFSSNTCFACGTIKLKIKKAMEENFENFELFEVDITLARDISSYFMVLSTPTILVFFDKKEFKRYGKNISISVFVEELERPYEIFYS